MRRNDYILLFLRFLAQPGSGLDLAMGSLYVNIQTDIFCELLFGLSPRGSCLPMRVCAIYLGIFYLKTEASVEKQH